ncbi:hypothetical protein NLI96_g10305 [Meripilus lineatus]|uniref:Uncharacterized protein n=1 Tax=Meripilus lineatus TaxID=2056292 RepID=A0AAD5YA82_9APHY|nr:hypothetical protein NLI96_g10305 [Physisporinus lineatus]
MSTGQGHKLSSEQREHFLEHGWLKVSKAVPPENIRRFTEDVWVRLGYDPDDQTTWTQEKIHMPRHREVITKDFMPKAWDAMCEILGGEDRIDTTLFESCGDSLIVNLGSEGWDDIEIHPKDLGNWHIDGDWFTHFLDSGEQGLTVIVLFNDIEPRAGGTYISPDGINNVIKWLYDHPEGSSSIPRDADGSQSACSIQTCKEFVELTGEAGDVILLHPFMSLVEQKILRTLGVDSLTDWKIASERRRFTPRSRGAKDAMIIAEVERLKVHALKTGKPVDSMHINGPVPYQIVV